VQQRVHVKQKMHVNLAGGDFEAIMSVKTNWNKAVGGADK
jgi:hypothetical protein